jgi:hypothetical protein
LKLKNSRDFNRVSRAIADVNFATNPTIASDPSVVDLIKGGLMKIQILALSSALAILVGCQSHQTASTHQSDKSYSSRIVSEPSGASTSIGNAGISYDSNNASALPGSSAATLPTEKVPDVKASQDASSLNSDIPARKESNPENQSDGQKSINGGIGIQGEKTSD